MTQPTKRRTRFACRSCGVTQPRWLGQCPECGEWNTLEEEAVPSGKRAAAPGRDAGASRAVPSTTVYGAEIERLSTRIGELDRVLGGGCVPGSVVLVGGEPGIGKSTLLLQAAGLMAGSGLRVLYVTGEESVEQVAARAQRVCASSPGLMLLAETALEAVAAEIESAGPQVLFVDSAQTLRSPDLEGTAGTVGQVRAVAAEISDRARATRTCAFLVGHVTKEGTIAGPKMLEHMVDVVLYFEGESTRHYRVVRNAKNRYGSTNEIGVFEMTGRGLVEVADPSSAFMDRDRRPVPGVAIHAGVEGGRGLVVEIQALVTAPGYGTPRRAVTGLDTGRVSLVLAVLDRKAGLAVLDKDVFLNAPGGLRVTEPAGDLASAAAIVSAVMNRPADRYTAWSGEIGLTGEIRWVPRMEPRVAEARKLGMKRLVVPEANLGEAARISGESLKVIGLRDVARLVEMAGS